jgi:hypothetical protein
MNSSDAPNQLPPLDLSGWRLMPGILMIVGAILSVIGLVKNPAEFGYDWLLAFMFYLSIALGGLFLVMIHHLTDAGWSVGIRRFCEHLGALLCPWLALLFMPVLLLAPKIYRWMTMNPHDNRALNAKLPLFTWPGFCAASLIIFGIWWLLSSRLRYWSLRQDETGEARCTYRMRFHSGWGILAFAGTVTMASILWMGSLQYQWTSTIYGMYFFGSCAFVGTVSAYFIAMLLQRQGMLTRVLQDSPFYYLGTLLFAFTLLYSYFGFAQYFVVWNGNIPDETFWYLIRENHSWWALDLLIIFGHFLLPFLVLLPIWVKSNFKIMFWVCVWAWAMNYADLVFNILPVAHPNGYPFHWLWLQFGCLAFMGGFLSWRFLRNFAAHAPFPKRDPRLLEAMGVKYELPEDIAATTSPKDFGVLAGGEE